MSYTTVKTIKGHDYLYQVRSERRGGRVVQIFERYLGPAGNRELTTTQSTTITPPVEPQSDKLTTTTKGNGKRLLAKILKADFKKKTDLWYKADLSKEEQLSLVREMILTLPKGYYKVHSREYGNNIVDAIWEKYGWMPSMLVNESMMLGMQALYPDRVYASFTLGLDAVEIKKAEDKR